MRLSTRIVVSLLAVGLSASAGAQTSLAGMANVQSDSLHVVRDTAVTAPLVARPSATGAVTAGASLTGLRAGVHERETSRPSKPNAQATHANLGQARAMMIVGGAALIAGAIIGGTPGTIIMVGGAVIGLYGLYDYLQ